MEVELAEYLLIAIVVLLVVIEHRLGTIKRVLATYGSQTVDKLNDSVSTQEGMLKHVEQILNDTDDIKSEVKDIRKLQEPFERGDIDV